MLPFIEKQRINSCKQQIYSQLSASLMYCLSLVTAKDYMQQTPVMFSNCNSYAGSANSILALRPAMLAVFTALPGPST